MSSTANTSPDAGKRLTKPRTSGAVGAVGTRPDKKGCSERSGSPGRSSAPARGAQSHATHEARFRNAVALYRDTTLSVAEIARRTGVSYQGLRNQLYRHHRELLLARHGIESPQTSDTREPAASGKTDAKQGRPTPREVKLRGERGQTPAARKKYGAAIRACDDLKYIVLNVSQIARMFGLQPTALGNQLHAHYPDILERRERERQLRGLSSRHRRGARPESVAQYAPAVGMLRGGAVTVREAARACGVSAAGLYEHLLFYHRDIVERCAAARAAVREVSRSAPRGAAQDTARGAAQKAAREAV